MRSISDVLREKEMRMQMLRDEIEKLHIAARILEEAGDTNTPPSEPPRPIAVNKNWP